MQENWSEITNAFDDKNNYVLAVIVSTSGSTYRKAGTMMLINEQGEYTGLLSGGCLESDICLHAQSVFENGQSITLSYDLKADADLLWGMGLGCEGAIDITLLSLTPENKHQGFNQLLNHLSKRGTGYYCLIKDNDNFHGAFHTERPEQYNNPCLVIPILPPYQVNICGAGPDVLPVAKMMKDLGWQIKVYDHRTEFLSKIDVQGIETIRLRAEESNAQHFDDADAVVIMSHHLHRDGLFLSAALASDASYIGLLGPSGRRDKLLKAQKLTASDVKGRVFGPVGLDIGGRTPVAIALSICAEIQKQLSENMNTHTSKAFWLGDA